MSFTEVLPINQQLFFSGSSDDGFQTPRTQMSFDGSDFPEGSIYPVEVNAPSITQDIDYDRLFRIVNPAKISDVNFPKHYREATMFRVNKQQKLRSGLINAQRQSMMRDMYESNVRLQEAKFVKSLTNPKF